MRYEAAGRKYMGIGADEVDSYEIGEEETNNEQTNNRTQTVTFTSIGRLVVVDQRCVVPQIVELRRKGCEGLDVRVRYRSGC